MEFEQWHKKVEKEKFDKKTRTVFPVRAFV
jgi:hypothetical protein